jgi:hypothetical protein
MERLRARLAGPEPLQAELDLTEPPEQQRAAE